MVDGDGGGIIVCPGSDKKIVVSCPVSVLRPDQDNAVHHGWILVPVYVVHPAPALPSTLHRECVITSENLSNRSPHYFHILVHH